MITFSKLGKHGKLGNQLFQIAALIGFSERYGCELVLPEWKYANYFDNPFPTKNGLQTDLVIEEKDYNYVPGFWEKYANDFRIAHVDILGWMQSEKYWEHCREKVYKAFCFKNEFAAKLRSSFSAAFDKDTIAISIRRGDFITNPNFYLLPLDYYLGALKSYFPRYKDYNIIFFSDDPGYCRMHIKPLPNIYLAAGLAGIEQLCLMSMCNHFVISNSSFSWWGAMLGEKQNSVIVRSPHQLEGEFLKTFNTKDYYPERWMQYDHVGKHPDNSDITASKNRLMYYAFQNFCYGKLKKIKRKILVGS